MAMGKKKYVVAGKVMPKFFNWLILLKDIQSLIKKVDIILFPILPLKKAKILETINILRYIVEYLGLKNIVEDKVVLTKGDYLTITNVIYILY